MVGGTTRTRTLSRSRRVLTFTALVEPTNPPRASVTVTTPALELPRRSRRSTTHGVADSDASFTLSRSSPAALKEASSPHSGLEVRWMDSLAAFRPIFERKRPFWAQLRVPDFASRPRSFGPAPLTFSPTCGWWATQLAGTLVPVFSAPFGPLVCLPATRPCSVFPPPAAKPGGARKGRQALPLPQIAVAIRPQSASRRSSFRRLPAPRSFSSLVAASVRLPARTRLSAAPSVPTRTTLSP